MAEMMTDSLQNELDSIDEKESRGRTLPTAGTKIVEVPDLRSLDGLIISRCADYLVNAINESLINGDLCSILNAAIITEEVSRDDCYFTDFTYWRLNQTDLLADIDAQVTLTALREDQEYTSIFTFNITLWFNADEGFQCELYEICGLEDMPERSYWKLDRFAEPILSNDTVEDAAEKMWDKKHSIAMTDATERTPAALAEAYHLDVQRRRLAAGMYGEYVLFFQDGTIWVQDESEPGSKKLPPPREEKIKANTIVINTGANLRDNGELAIYTACFQYEWHYLFYSLNRCVNSDPRQFKQKKIEIQSDRELKNPLAFLEPMAWKGGLALMMPLSIMRDKVYREFRKASVARSIMGYYNHEGWKMDRVIRTIADEYDLRKFRVRQRVIGMGRIAARGAINYDPDTKQYFTPYGFDPDQVGKHEDFYITRGKLMKIYNVDGDFRDFMHNGDFAFLDGLVCLNDTCCIVRKGDHNQLTASANASVDHYCLRFSRQYIQGNSIYGFDWGAFEEKYSVILDRYSEETIAEKANMKEKLLKKIPEDFGSALQFLMNSVPGGRMKDEVLAARTGMKAERIAQYRTDPKMLYSLDEVILMCVALNLLPWLSDALLERAELKADRTGPLSFYGFIIDCLYMDTVKNVKAFLETNGLKIL